MISYHIIAGWQAGRLAVGRLAVSCDIHTHTPAQESSTNFLLHPFLLRRCSTHRLAHGHGYECRSPGRPKP